MNKSKLIKRYVGDVIIKEDFSYDGFVAGTWNFSRNKGNVKQEIIIMQHRFFSNQVKLIFNTGIYGWGDQELRHFIPQYKSIEFWKYESEEEYVEILKLFSTLILQYGLDILEKMSTPKDAIYPTPEMNEYLYQYYMTRQKNKYQEYCFRESKVEIEEISKILSDNKNKDFNEIQELLIEMAVRYINVIQNELGGELVLKDNKCVMQKIGHWKTAFLPLGLIIAYWKRCREEINDDILLVKYQQLADKYS
jgi:hypothetical protein